MSPTVKRGLNRLNQCRERLDELRVFALTILTPARERSPVGGFSDERTVQTCTDRRISACFERLLTVAVPLRPDERITMGLLMLMVARSVLTPLQENFWSTCIVLYNIEQKFRQSARAEKSFEGSRDLLQPLFHTSSFLPGYLLVVDKMILTA